MESSDLINALEKKIRAASLGVEVTDVGHVVEVGDGVVRVMGLPRAAYLEMLIIKTKGGTERMCVAFNLEEQEIGAVVIGPYEDISEGDEVIQTGKILQTKVGSSLIGRVVNPLGEPIDGGPPVVSDIFYPVEKVAPGVITRRSVSVPLQTGIKAIDSMIPIGRGQRELIIGDRQTGKTAIAVDTILNQRGKGVYCFYVAIGQKESKVARIVALLKEYGALEYTTVIVAGASDPASFSYLAPYVGCAMAEFFMDKGKDALIVYDDLSRHAVAYREIALVLRRPPGREAYPGDIFYLHSRLLERAARLSPEYGGGSLTALPIIETQAGDISAYIPTNVISITDGQIYLESDLFYQGVRPAVNVGLSVSRVGSAAQVKAMKKVAGKLRLDLAQYRELAAFTQFGSDLDSATRRQIERGKVMTELLKQKPYQPLSVSEQVAILYAGVEGFLDGYSPERIIQFEQELLSLLRSEPAVNDTIQKTGDLDTQTEKKLRELIHKALALLPENEEEKELGAGSPQN